MLLYAYNFGEKSMKREDKIIKLKSIPYGTRPKVLLVGNGINLSFAEKEEDIDESEDRDAELDTNRMLEKKYKKIHNGTIPSDEFKNLPFPLKVIVATKDDVKSFMGDLSISFRKHIIKEEQKEFLKHILDCGWDSILTTNYSLEIEQTYIPNYKCTKVSDYYRYTNDYKNESDLNKKDKYNIYKCIDIPGYDSKLWHIHGIALNRESMVMGHYYYGEL